MPWSLAIGLTAVCLLFSIYYTRFLIRFLQKYHLFDHPNERSNHAKPTPRGGGIAVLDTITLAWIVLFFAETDATLHHWPILVGAIALGLVSLMDDMRPIPARWRFLAQLLVVFVCMSLFFDGRLVFHGLFSPIVDLIVASICWLWFINLYNFMDGIDGITGSETIAICLGIILIASNTDFSSVLAVYAAIIAAATLGFLRWNWHPAKVFMGDVGSIPLGFLLGWLLLELAVAGYWAAALILPGYYLADSTYTLIKRIIRGDKAWEAHSEHFYQQAVRSGMSHSQVVTTITIANILLVCMALFASLDKANNWITIAIAGLAVIGLLVKLKPRRDG